MGQEGLRDYEGAWGGLYYVLEVATDQTLCPGTYEVPFTVTDPDGLSSSATLYVQVVGNRPPQATPPQLRGETTVTITPAGAVYGPVVMTIPRIWDPDGDAVYVEGYGLPPTYASNLSLFLGSLVATYWPYPEAADDFCRAVRERDVIVDEFTVILRDACGATTEIPATVTITVVDKVPPNMVYPARDRTVECDGQGNTAELSSWLRTQGGAWAYDNCCGITWTNDYSPERFITTCGKAGYVTVTFTATDCAGNSSSTTATFRVVDTTPPEFSLFPADVDIGCNPSDTSPAVTGSPVIRDVCDPNPTLSYADRVFQEGCRVMIERTWRATDACGNTSERTQRITYTVDTTPPELVVPGDVAVECDQVPEVGEATVTDNCDPAPTVEYLGEERVDGPCPHSYTLIRTWRAVDKCGNAVMRSQRITVRDTRAPVLSVPGDVELGCGCTRPDVSPDATGWAQAQDGCDPNPALTYQDVEEVNGEVHTITRTWIARDACGNESRGIQRITFRIDRTPPVLTVPADVNLGCNPQNTSPDVTGWATANDNCDLNPKIIYTDKVTQVGCRVTIERTWRATDACGNASERTQRITYTVDTTPPSLNCPSEVRAYIYGCSGASGTWVNFPISAWDSCDPAPQAWCTPSGGWFGEGTTWVTVNCSARDACGNEISESCTFPVTVERINNPPVARSDSVDCNGFCSIPVLLNDYDPDGDRLILVDAYAQYGTAWVSGSMVYYTTAGWSGPQPPGPGVTDTITYIVTDGCLTTTGTVTVHITCTICPLSLPPRGEP